MPPEFNLQVQTGLLVTRRKWMDFISYSGGLPMVTIRMFPDPVVQAAIIQAATAFEERLTVARLNYGAMLDHWDRVLAPFRNKENK